MSALPSVAAAKEPRASSTSNAGSQPAAAVAGQQALLTNNAHANTTLLARTAVSTMPVDSAVDAHPIGVTPVAVSAAVVELQPAEAAPLPQPFSADSAKSLADTSLGSSAQPQAEGQQSSGSRDKREKQNSSPSRGQIASDPKAMLLASTAPSQPAQPQGRNSSPSSSSSAAAELPGVGAGAAAAAFSTSAPPSLSAAFAAAKKVFDQRKASPPSSAAVAHHDGMRDDDDGSMAAVVPPPTLPTSAQNCLVVDSQRLASSPADLAQFNTIRNAVLSWQEMIASVQKWLPALEGDGLVTVLSDAHFSRLHLHFKDHAALAHALKAVPFLVRCCVYHTPDVWNKVKPHWTCSTLTRYQQPEALHFTVTATDPLPSPSGLSTAIQEFVKKLGIDAQDVRQSSQAQEKQRTGSSSVRQHLSFWVLPREADQNALVTLINRVHKQHSLFGGLVHVQAPNCPASARCSECRKLGHQGVDCPLFSGTAVRLRFKDPMGPHDFRVLLNRVTSFRSAMLGNTHSADHWVPSHKATLFFDEPSSLEAIAAFTTTLEELTAICHGRLVDVPAHVDMTQAKRKHECWTCGDRDKAHKCLSASVVPVRLSAAQQQHAASSKPPAASNAASASAAAAPAAKSTAPPQTASASTKPKSLVDGLCAEWMRTLHCNRGKGCRLQHPKDWVILPNDICHQFAKQGSCQWGSDCKHSHVSLEQLKARSSAGAAASAPASSTKAAAAKAGSSKKKAAASASSNPFAPLAASSSSAASSAATASAAPTTPSKARAPSSLDMLASPSLSSLTRTQSTPATTAHSSAKKKLALGATARPAAAAAAAADQDGFTQHTNHNKRRRTAQESGEHSEEEQKAQTPRKTAKAAAAKQREDAISVSSSDAMEEL